MTGTNYEPAGPVPGTGLLLKLSPEGEGFNPPKVRQ